MSHAINPKRPRRFAREPQQPLADTSFVVNSVDDCESVEFAPPLDGEAQIAAMAAPLITSKASMVVSLLTREGGASIADLTTVTSWLPHTTRAALTGLRKKGHAIVRDKIDGVTRYAILPAVSE